MNYKIGNLIKKQREKLNITSTELANKIGVSQGTISNIENGKIGKRASSLDVIRKIISELKIPLENDVKEYLNFHNDIAKHNESFNKNPAYSAPFIKGSQFVFKEVGKVSEVEIKIDTYISEDIDLSNLSASEKNKIQGMFIFESGIITKTIEEFMEQNTSQLEELINKNLNDEFKKLLSSYKSKKSSKDDI